MYSSTKGRDITDVIGFADNILVSDGPLCCLSKTAFTNMMTHCVLWPQLTSEKKDRHIIYVGCTMTVPISLAEAVGRSQQIIKLIINGWFGS